MVPREFVRMTRSTHFLVAEGEGTFVVPLRLQQLRHNILLTYWQHCEVSSNRLCLYQNVFVHRSSRRRQRCPEACHGFVRLGPLGFVGFFRCIVPILHYAVIYQILDVSLKIVLFVSRNGNGVFEAILNCLGLNRHRRCHHVIFSICGIEKTEHFNSINSS